MGAYPFISGAGRTAGGLFGAIYAVAAGVLGIVFLYLCIRLYRRADRGSAVILFHYSLLYLALIFMALAADRILYVTILR